MRVTEKSRVHVPLPPDESRVHLVRHVPGPRPEERLRQRLREQGMAVLPRRRA